MMAMAPLTAHDRCDRCGALAIAATRHAPGAEPLLWCGHHFREHEEKLTPLLVTYQAVTTDEFEEFERA